MAVIYNQSQIVAEFNYHFIVLPKNYDSVEDLQNTNTVIETAYNQSMIVEKV